ncbi:MAG: diapophytoene dehydrogenase [Flavobacteriaceae bacterium]|nr:diapophytoene dehydrogenase [Flavobacteriaceae bacterium]
MGKYFLKLPKMGESVAEATLISWLKDVGDNIDVDESVVEIATDKVDSDVPSEFPGKLIEKRFKVNDVIKVGEVIAVIESDEIASEINQEQENSNIKTGNILKVEQNQNSPDTPDQNEIGDITIKNNDEKEISEITFNAGIKTQKLIDEAKEISNFNLSSQNNFLSPLVKSIVNKENLSKSELLNISGTGKNGRITKKDILEYLKTRDFASNGQKLKQPDNKIIDSDDQIIKMSRVSKLISNHMINSQNTSAHVQAFIEVDVTNLWNWREKIKQSFFDNNNEKLTFTPLFILAVIKALREFPILNSSIDGDTIHKKRNINIGMATAMDDGNLIVPVIKNADYLNLIGLTKAVNDLSDRARKNKLLPDEVKDGTYTVSNVGNFGTLMGTPIINQPQVGILAVGIIRKVPSVIETDKGDYIAIRKKLILSHSFDHRIINGAVGGNFIKYISDYLENWDLNYSF